MAITPPIIYHQTQEENLLAAKRAVKAHKFSMLKRLTDTADDVIDVVDGNLILERHVCKSNKPTVTIVFRNSFCVEDLALYQ